MGALTDMREGLRANLATITDLQVSAYMLSSPTPPSAHVVPGGDAGDIDYDQAMGRGLDLWRFTVQAFVGLPTDQGAQVLLDTFMEPSGPQSVKEALESDCTLGGAADDLHVVSCTGYKQFVFEGRPPLLGAGWHVHVYANGS
jgi:hypothetical protein